MVQASRSPHPQGARRDSSDATTSWRALCIAPAVAFFAAFWLLPMVRLLVLLTKADKLNRQEAQASLKASQEVLGEVASDASDVGVTLFSALSKLGVGDVAVNLRSWVDV